MVKVRCNFWKRKIKIFYCYNIFYLLIFMGNIRGNYMDVKVFCIFFELVKVCYFGCVVENLYLM